MLTPPGFCSFGGGTDAFENLDHSARRLGPKKMQMDVHLKRGDENMEFWDLLKRCLRPENPLVLH